MAVALDATNLLAVVIRDGVCEGVRRRVDAACLYTVVEFLFSLKEVVKLAAKT